MCVDYTNAVDYRPIVNGIIQTLPIFKGVVAPLRRCGLHFAYFRVFPCGCYYLLIDDIPFLITFIETIDRGYIFYGRNITGPYDYGYQTFQWPLKPLNKNMEIYYAHNKWNGVTICKTYKNFVDCYGIMTDIADTQVYDLCLSNKGLILDCVRCFDSHKSLCNIPTIVDKTKLFCFRNGCDLSALTKPDAMNQQNLQLALVEMRIGANDFTAQESLVYPPYSAGVPAKTIANQRDNSHRTIEKHIENIRSKMYAR
jgi:hypothetical protein